MQFRTVWNSHDIPRGQKQSHCEKAQLHLVPGVQCNIPLLAKGALCIKLVRLLANINIQYQWLKVSRQGLYFILFQYSYQMKYKRAGVCAASFSVLQFWNFWDTRFG